MIASAQALIVELRQRGAVTEGPDVAVVDDAPGRPWYIGLLLGTAGWVAGIFILIFVAMIWRGEGAAGGIVSGLVLLGAAWGLYKVDREGAFVSQLALALSIAGQFAMLFGLGSIFVKGSGKELAGISFIALLLQLALVVVMPNALHRTMSALFACTAWALFVRFGLWDHSPGLWGSHRQDETSHALAFAGWAVSWLPIAGVLYIAIRREASWMAAGWSQIVRPAAVGVILGMAITTLLSQPLETFPFDHAQGLRGGFSLWPLLSAFAALAALVAAFALGSRGLTAVCVIAALIHISHFYYAMGTSLLVKALTMLVIGALLLYISRQLQARPRAAP
jgi:hypothetical protein